MKRRAESDARGAGCYLNHDLEFRTDLLEGLKQNEERYGYNSCPCRLASGIFEYDRDILCPCDYRDPDVIEFGACYCGLFVRKDIFDGEIPLQPIPERRPLEKQRKAYGEAAVVQLEKKTELSDQPVKELAINLKLWYCRQCGYVAFREEPPYICPICKAKRQMFAKID
jgi:ferredoxin-thioredoxin reductase catalytic subunit